MKHEGLEAVAKNCADEIITALNQKGWFAKPNLAALRVFICPFIERALSQIPNANGARTAAEEPNDK
jgi:hypothetical protein